MSTDRIVIDQAKIRISDEIAARIKPGSEFPRSLAWWQRIVPCWLTATEDEGGHIVLTPSGRDAAGSVYELTPVITRREIRYGLDWLTRWNGNNVDFTDALS
ncbi:hypothetical protein OG552_10750 [Streptomyces sp. NBC_01476]|uniref:hypothetical protein n=1 Tax=Streptomyces sp. NBC_01476 TaxID=2903881 RepID=UPI002E3688B8|nr:hypothetical protein [Streptomyces sp. NBC_01476]